MDRRVFERLYKIEIPYGYRVINHKYLMIIYNKERALIVNFKERKVRLLNPNVRLTRVARKIREDFKIPALAELAEFG